jgi:hypothetical protein
MIIVLLSIVKWLFIVGLCSAGIVVGAVILGILGIDVPHMQFIINAVTLPMLFFDLKIVRITISILCLTISIFMYFQLRKM